MSNSVGSVRPSGDRELMGHLFRRAAFGATNDELDRALEQGYENVVEQLVDPTEQAGIDDELLFRYHVGMKECRLARPAQAYWIFRLVNTKCPLEERMALFFHGVFTAAFAKLNYAKPIADQVARFRRGGLGSYRALLKSVSEDPAMLVWLDNYQNIAGQVNENYARELMELFALGIGNYTEDDVKSCARAFTGYTIVEPVPSDLPYGRFDWVFRYRDDLHDHGEKTFLGRVGDFDGDDIIGIILEQPAAATRLAFHLHRYFVADEPDPEAVRRLADACTALRFDLRDIMRHLLLSPYFRAETSWYAKIKSPVDLVVDVLRRTQALPSPDYDIQAVVESCTSMGQSLLDPPTVEGWPSGVDWINTASLTERVNFAASYFSDLRLPGVRLLAGSVLERPGVMSPQELVDRCLVEMGVGPVEGETWEALARFADRLGPVMGGAQPDSSDMTRLSKLLRVICAIPEFQLC